MNGKINPVILKLGGSTVTNKSKPYSFLHDEVTRIAREILKADLKELVIVHGGGSFGHPIAHKYKLASGYLRQSQLEGLIKTRQAMSLLNKYITDLLVKEGLRTVSLQPSAFIVTRNFRITAFESTVIVRMLRLGLIPVLYGDVVLDSTRGFAILSGDQIVSKIAEILGSERIILACDVDGVYAADPKIYPKAKLVRKLCWPVFKEKIQINQTAGSDVTGLMKGKLDEMDHILKQNIPIVIVNGLKKGRIYKALKGLTTIGTYLSLK